jgi:hypothetical protein
MKILKWLKSVKGEALLFIAFGVLFFVLLPLWLAWAYGGDAAETGESSGIVLLSPAYIVDLVWRLFRVPVAFLTTWVCVKIAFPTIENHIDHDVPGPNFRSDWEKMDGGPRVKVTIFVIVAVFLGTVALIVTA